MNINQGLTDTCKPLTAHLAVKYSVVHLVINNNRIMDIEEVAARFSVSTDRVEEWFRLLGLKTPEILTIRHFVLVDLCRGALLENPFVSEEELITNYLPIMRIADVVPIDPSAHPLGGEIFEGEIVGKTTKKDDREPSVSPLKLVTAAAKAIKGDSYSLCSYELDRVLYLWPFTFS